MTVHVYKYIYLDICVCFERFRAHKYTVIGLRSETVGHDPEALAHDNVQVPMYLQRSAGGERDVCIQGMVYALIGGIGTSTQTLRNCLERR